MPRPPKPFIHQRFFCTNVGGFRKRKLCRADEGIKAAKLALDRLKVKIADGDIDEPSPLVKLSHDGQPVADVVREYLEMKEIEVAPKTYESYRQHLADFLRRFGDRPIRSITLKDGLSFKQFLMKEKVWIKGKAPVTGIGNIAVNHRMRAAKMLFNWAEAERRRYILGNPWKEIGYLPEKGRERLLTDEEFSHLIANCANGGHKAGAHDMREILLTFRNTTMRPGELRLLKWSYIEWERNRITFPNDGVENTMYGEPPHSIQCTKWEKVLPLLGQFA